VTGLALGYGLQDAQKSMGIIVLALVTAGYRQDYVGPIWVVLAWALALATATYSGGWRIMRNLAGACCRCIAALAYPLSMPLGNG
jgi:inorganic phosphate transporter, PiT family